MSTDTSQPPTAPPAGAPADGQSEFLRGRHTIGSITDKISSIVLTQPRTRRWYIGFGIAFLLVLVLLYAVFELLTVGIGIWGVNIPVGWGFAITNFVWWIGIGHAGTLISAILLLLHQQWRTSINRFAEAMTLFAVACAGLFPLLHLGRPWFFYWLLPYPNTMDLWPQFRSPLVWDVFAVSTYFTVSLIFWYIGLVPDLATLRDRTQNRWARILYGMMALGWRGSARHWHRYETAYLLLAGLATPLVISVHTVVSFDFAVAILPGWHTTIFPPYFVAGAIYSGFAMVLVLCIPIRKFYGLQDFITLRHLQVMGKILLATGLCTSYGYFIEAFMAWYGKNQFEEYVQLNRMLGPYAPVYWAVICCNVLAVQVLWWKRARSSELTLFLVALVVLVGMWLERYMIIVTSLHRDFLPSSWGMYQATIWDWATFIGTLGLFFTLFFLFIRFLPMISISEMRTLVPGTHAPEEGRVMPRTAIYGLMTEFDNPERLLAAVRRAREDGYQEMDAYTPYPVEGLSEELGLARSRVPFIVLVGGIVGACVGYFMQYYTMAVDYPMNVGGRPYNSWPIFIPITFEVTVLIAALSAVIGMLVLNGLPMPYHPLFNVPRFARASRDGFFFCIEATDPRFDLQATHTFLAGLNAREVVEVPH